MANEPLADQMLAILAKGGASRTGLPGYLPHEMRREHAYLSQSLRGARRYFVDDEVSTLASRLCGQYPQLIGEILRRARLPRERILLEYSPRAFVSASGYPVTPDAPEASLVLVERVGNSLTQCRLTSIGVPPGGYAHVSPISIFYDLEEPVSESADMPFLIKTAQAYMKWRGVSVLADDGSATHMSQPEMIEDSVRFMINSATVGTAGRFEFGKGRDPAEVEEEKAYLRQQILDLQKHARHELTPINAGIYRRLVDHDREHSARIANIIGEAIIEFAGQWRFVISCLYLINGQDFTGDVTYRHGQSRYIGGGKIVPYLEHRRVSLKVPRLEGFERSIRQLTSSTPRRRHEVDGHWRHRHGLGKEECQHAFVSVTEIRERCVLCDYTRWWIKEYERGDASIGRVTKDRIVKRR